MCGQGGIRSLDWFGAPIGLTFNGEPTYKTKCGGYVTLCLLVLIGGNLFLNIIGLILNPQYTYRVQSTYDQYSTGERTAWTLST